MGFLDLLPSSTLPPANGGLSANGKAGVAALLSLQNQSNALFLAKMGTAYSQPALSGDWFFVSYNPLSSYGGHDRITFNDAASFVSLSHNFVPTSGTALLSATGEFHLPAIYGMSTTPFGSHDCWLDDSHSTSLCVQTGDSTQPMTVVGVRLGADATYSQASMAGTFHLAGVVTVGTGSTAVSQTRQGTITVMGNGQWTGSIMSTGETSPVSLTIGGTYTYDGPANPGRYTLVDSQSTPANPVSMLCGVSADMGTTVCHYVSGQNLLGIYMGVRAEQQAP